jgi:hypothetical protein
MRLFVISAVQGLALAAVFVGLLLWLNIGSLWQLVSASPVGWLAVVMLITSGTVLFSGVQFALALMRIADRAGGQGGGGGRRRKANWSRIRIASGARR